MARAEKRRPPRRPVTLDGIFSSEGTEGWGAKVFEWTHPEQVAAEYAAVGQDAPPPTSASDVLAAANEQVLDTAHAAGESLATGFDLAKKALIAGAVLFAGWLVLEILKEFHKGK